jgi:type IV conjugative transfer system protein TraE
MNLRFQKANLSRLQWQRNALGILSASLLVVVLLQTTLLFFKDTKTILLPAELKQGYWIEGNRFSPSYLEEQGMYFAHLLLDVSPANILDQGEVLLRYVDSKAYGDFRARLLQEEQRLKRDSLSLNFVAIECEVIPQELALEITGDLNGYVAAKKISSHRETYRIEFSSHKGRLFLKSFQVIKTDQEDLPAQN